MQADCSIMMANDLSQRPVTIDVVDQPIDAVLSYLSRQMGADISRTGSLYYIGALKPEDVGVMVHRMRRLSSTEISNAVSVMRSDVGTVHAFPDGLLVVGDRVEVLRRIVEMIDRIEETDSVTWAVQLHLVSLAQNAVKELGLDVVPSLDVGLSYATGPGLPSTGGLSADIGLQSVLRATRENSDNKQLADPFFLVLDGTPAKLRRGTRYPIALRSTSDQGTTTTRDYQFIDVGLSVSVTVRELSAESARLNLEVELSQVESVTPEGVPIHSAESLTAQSDVRSGGVYLLASLDRSEQSQRSARGTGLGGRKQHDQGLLQVWARIYRIGGSLSNAN